MKVMEIPEATICTILKIIAGILHLGNISFVEEMNKARPVDDACNLIVSLLGLIFSLIRLILNNLEFKVLC